jgi:single-strand DNA-binding protein
MGSADINKLVIVGRLTRDADLSYTNTGYPLTKFSIAVNRRKKSGDQWIDEGNFFDVTLWGKRGEALNQYLTKGQQVAVEGELQQDRWEKDGVKRSKVSIDCKNLQLLGGKKQDQQPSQQSNEQPFDSYSGGGSFEDDIPF